MQRTKRFGPISARAHAHNVPPQALYAGIGTACFSLAVSNLVYYYFYALLRDAALRRTTRRSLGTPPPPPRLMPA